MVSSLGAGSAAGKFPIPVTVVPGELALKDINPDVVMPMHCTGEVFLDIMAKEMPGKLVRSYTGSRYIFSA